VAGAFRSTDLAWGAGAGLGVAVGVSLLYHGLAVGVMSVVAPVTAVGSACIPVLFGLVTGERPSAAALVGVVLALAAVTLLAVFPGEEDDARPGARRAGVVMGLVSGCGFGAYFVLLDHAADGAGLWPLVGSRGTSVAVLGTVVLLARQPLVPAGVGRDVGLIGVLDVVANVAFLLATRRGLLSLVALLASLYPAGTVLLARVVLRERLSPAQVAGLAGAGGAIVLIALA
jgi:drug/metabolite transporter (DMT)-like permease